METVKIKTLKLDGNKVAISGEVVSIDRKYRLVLGEDVLKIVIKDDSGQIALSPLWLSKDRCLDKLEVGDTLFVAGNKRNGDRRGIAGDFYVDDIQLHRLSLDHQARITKAEAEEQAALKNTLRVLSNRKRQIDRQRKKEREARATAKAEQKKAKP